MQIHKLFQSTLFRLALFYAAFFCVSVIGLLAFVYFATAQEMETEIKHRITTQLNQAQNVFNIHGITDLKKQIGDFLEEEDEGLALYLLIDGEGHVLAGNMESWPEDSQYNDSWLSFDLESQKGGDTHVLARDTSLAGGYRLLVGYSLRGPDKTKEVILNVVSVSIVMLILITVIGSILFSNVIKHKLEHINHICKQVIEGNLDVKVPVTGGEDEFDFLASNVNAMLRRIAELIKGLKETSDNIAHDLRTPLGRHRIRLEGMITHPVAERQMRDNIKMGVEEVDTILETLNSILRISQAQSGVASEHLSQFDVSAVLMNVIEFYTELAEEKHITIHEQIDEGVAVMADKPLLTQAIANLIDNAVKYTPVSGVITVTLSTEGHTMICEVADNGAGIPSAFYHKVKERFFRLEESRTSPGTGLGLSLVDAVANLHRGELMFADNQPGLKAILILPIVVLPDAIPPAI